MGKVPRLFRAYARYPPFMTVRRRLCRCMRVWA